VREGGELQEKYREIKENLWKIYGSLGDAKIQEYPKKLEVD
jgi:hypothetical protein